MRKILRVIKQTMNDGRIHETQLIRSDSFLYLAILVAESPGGIWNGETGLCRHHHVSQLFENLRKIAYNFHHEKLPIKREGAIVFGATLVREGESGVITAEQCTDIESVSLYFSGHEKLKIFVDDLEGALSWAA